jgi:hypothetical protein
LVDSIPNTCSSILFERDTRRHCNDWTHNPPSFNAMTSLPDVLRYHWHSAVRLLSTPLTTNFY